MLFLTASGLQKDKTKKEKRVTATEKCEAEYNTIHYLIFKSKETYSKQTNKKKLTVNTLKAPQWRSGNGWVLILLKSSNGWLDKDVNHDSVIVKRSSVCCSGYIYQKNVQKQKSLVRIINKIQVLSTCSESLSYLKQTTSKINWNTLYFQHIFMNEEIAIYISFSLDDRIK